MKTILWMFLVAPFALFGDIAVSLPASGSSTTSSGDTLSFGRWSSGNGGFQISWNISQTGSNYSYIYNIQKEIGGNHNLSGGVNTLILELNPSITPSNLSTVITGANEPIISGPRTFTPGDSGSSSYPFLPGSIYGIQFDMGGIGNVTLSFTSTNAPVWGSFYSDNGKTGFGSRGYAYNTSFGSDPTISTTDFSNWVPTVGGATVLAPEPSTMLVLGTTLVAAAYLRQKRKNAQKS